MIIIGLCPRKDILEIRINNRVDEMINNGLVKEVKSLLNGMEFDVAKEMIKTGIETLNSDIDVDSLDEDVLETILKKDNTNRVVH